MMSLTVANFIGFGISALITLIISVHLIKSYLKSKEITVGYFASFITARFGIFLFFALTCLIYVISGNLLISSILFLMGWLMVYISLIFPPLLFSSLKWPRMKKIYPGIIAGLGILGIILAAVRFTPATINPDTGIALANIFQFSAMLYMICKFFGVLPLSILFLSQTRKSEKWMRIRSFLIGLGLFWIVSTMIVPNFLGDAWAGIYSGIGDIFIFIGVKFGIPKNRVGE